MASRFTGDNAWLRGRWLAAQSTSFATDQAAARAAGPSSAGAPAARLRCPGPRSRHGQLEEPPCRCQQLGCRCCARCSLCSRPDAKSPANMARCCESDVSSVHAVPPRPPGVRVPRRHRPCARRSPSGRRHRHPQRRAHAAHAAVGQRWRDRTDWLCQASFPAQPARPRPTSGACPPARAAWPLSAPAGPSRQTAKSALALVQASAVRVQGRLSCASGVAALRRTGGRRVESSI